MLGLSDLLSYSLGGAELAFAFFEVKLARLAIHTMTPGRIPMKFSKLLGFLTIQT